MRKFLLIVAGIFITVCFSLYILDMGWYEMIYFLGYPGGNQHHPEVEIDESVADKPVITGELDPLARAVNEPLTIIEGDWKLIWSDEFDELYLDLERWTKVDRKDNYNNELQYYTPPNSYLQDGCLYLTAKNENKEGKPYTSAMVQTMNKLSFCYGKIEARIKLPVGKGLFPAFWLLSYTGESEIDIMEMIGSEPDIIYGVNHYLSENKLTRTYSLIEIDSPEQFHVYTLEWEEHELRWYVDGTMFHQSYRVPSEEMYIIFTLAVGGDWPGYPDHQTVFPCDFVVDYVKLYRHN
ncbi:Glycosyl hydrolases family 16 (modular protein) [anaerobic digester metagenome]|uniref:Glycosyl hydrolases family 16 (Modular protein) n=1 Tax=anaerobic digester metagenome TaxID=1263854 RepID=A0A485M3J1_9ZZZZ